MAEENAEGLEGLDDFGDDFGNQLDSFMEGEEEEEGDSELDSFFEDLSTIDDLEMKEEGDESEAESESGDEKELEEEADEAVAATPAAAPADEEKPSEKKEEKKPDKPKKEKKEKGQRKPLLIPALIVCLVGMVLGAVTIAILYFLNMPEGVPEELAEEEVKPAPAAVFKEPEPEPKPQPKTKPKPKPDSRVKGTRYYVQVANCVFDDCVKEYRRLLKTHGYKSRMVKSTETSSMAEVVSKQVIGDEASVKLVNQINRNNREAGQAFRTKGKQGYRISMGLFPDLERAGRVRNYLNQEFGKQSFFEIKRATEKITYRRVQAGGYRTKKQAESLRRLLGRRDKNFESAFVVAVKR